MIELDFISVVVGYIVGVCLTWSLTFTLFGCEKCDAEQRGNDEYTYTGGYRWDYPYNRDTHP
jgi:hypothetical protein